MPARPVTPAAIPGPARAPGGDWREVRDLVQDAPGFTKRWLCHPQLDLFLWTDGSGALASLQLCFDKEADEHMLSWDRGSTPRVGLLDTGEEDPMCNRAPIISSAGSRSLREARAAWEACRGGLPPSLIAAVETALGWA